MSIALLRKEIKNFDRDALASLILDLYGKNKSIKEYLDFYLQPDEEALLEKYQKIVSDYIYPKRGWKSKVAKAKATIREFHKLYKMPEIEAELMYVYIVKGREFYMKEFNSSTLETSLFKMRETFFEFINTHELTPIFKERIERNVFLSKSFNA